jgi:hypothetical protein
MKLGHLGAAIVAAGMLAFTSGAFAFQFVNPDSITTEGTTKFSDPDQRTQSLSDRYGPGNSSTGTLKFGNSTLQFGMSGGNGNNAPSPWMQERFLQSPAARTVPSQGW